MKKILMIVHTFPPIGSVGGSIRIVKFLKYISELRPDFYSIVITLRNDFTLLNDFQLAQTSLSEIPLQNIKIIRTNTFQPRHPNSKSLINTDKIKLDVNNNSLKGIKFKFKRIYKFLERNVLIPDYGILWFPFSLKAALSQIRKNNIDIIYATAPPFSVLLQAAIIKKITKKKLVLDIKDDWIYQNRFKMRPFVVRKIEGIIERICIHSANKVILVTQNSYEDFIARYSKLKNKFAMIPNGCDIIEYQKYWNSNPIKNKKFEVIHSGVIADSRDPTSLFNALSELKEDKIINENNFQMKFIGILHGNILKIISEKKLEDIISVIKPLERKNYIDSIVNANLLLAFNYQVKTVIPGKIYDYWGTRRPILLLDSLDSAAAKLIYNNELGIVKEPANVKGIKDAILSYFILWNTNSYVKKNSIENLYKYDRKHLTKKFIEIIEST